MGPVERRAAPLARGFTLVELMVVICVVALLFGIALKKLLRYEELGERTAVEQNIAAINVALNMKFAALVIAGRPQAIEREVSANPIDLLARPPANYLGEMSDPPEGSVPAESWYYDIASHELVYMPSRPEHILQVADPERGLRFHVVLSPPAARDRDLPIHEIRQPFIEPVERYRWTLE